MVSETFPPLDENLTDFNDLAATAGLEVVREAINEAVNAAPPSPPPFTRVFLRSFRPPCAYRCVGGMRFSGIFIVPRRG